MACWFDLHDCLRHWLDPEELYEMPAPGLTRWHPELDALDVIAQALICSEVLHAALSKHLR
jgi:hypothetical protein